MITHLACIMDGNRRWAKKRALMPWYGHKEGAQAVRTVIRFCIDKGISYLSLYTFSLENFNRSQQEKDYIFSFLVTESEKELPFFVEHGIRIKFVGDRSLFPRSVVTTCQKIEEETKQCNKLTIQVLFCYGSRQEIIAAVQKIANQVALGQLTADEINDEIFKSNLWTDGVPDPDLIIRTGGLQRLSNFLLYQSAYSELYFLDCLWPDITERDLQAAADYFNNCKRNFGK